MTSFTPIVRDEKDVGPPNPELPSFLNAKKALRECRDFVEGRSGSMKYERVLGWGNFGIVTRWWVHDALGNRDRPVAIKYSMDEDERMQVRNEIKWMKEFRGLQHLAQLVTLGPGAFNSERAYNNEKRVNPLLIMEAFPECDLKELICRLGDTRAANEKGGKDDKKILEYIPTRILWRIFLCLARAIVGLAYTPPPSQRGAEYTEVIRDNRRAKAVIHFDIDPANVFIGQYKAVEEPEHRFMPTCKLGDFGLMSEWKECWNDFTKQQNYIRGKRPYYAPEQLDDASALAPGAIGTHTNVWGIGLVMADLMLLAHPMGLLSQKRAVTMPDGSSYELDTWGPYLVETEQKMAESAENPDLGRIDYSLRVLVARCLADSPKDRPSLEELLTLIQQGVEAGDRIAERNSSQDRNYPYYWRTNPDWYRRRPKADEEDDVLLRRFSDHYFLNIPPYKPDIYAGYWE
ncbi:kinase-like domain-containing protein [Xylariaceae sp. FL0662B]|nr:kinase-like domain-containing protein [Xylariaceae sp. FL0662B]